MSDRGVALVVKARAAAAAMIRRRSRGIRYVRAPDRGGTTGATVFKMKEVSRHKSLEILSDCVRNHELFRDHAGERFL